MKNNITIDKIDSIKEQLSNNPTYENSDSLYASEIQQLGSSKDIFKIVTDSFSFGYARGYSRGINGGFNITITKSSEIDRDKYIANLLKADLLLSDYVMTDNIKEKESILELLLGYISNINNDSAVFVFNKICDSSESEKEIYIEILTDILSSLKSDISEI